MEDVKQKKPKKAKHFRAIELRWSGLTAKEATNQLNKEFPADKTAVFLYENWFKKDGLLYHTMAEFMEEQNKAMRAAVQARLTRMTGKALDVLEAQVTKKGRYRYGMIANMAANSVLERAVGKADAKSGNVVVVNLVDPVKPNDVPDGYNVDGTPKTTVNAAVAASEEQAGVDEIKAKLGLSTIDGKTTRKTNPGASNVN